MRERMRESSEAMDRWSSCLQCSARRRRGPVIVVQLAVPAKRRSADHVTSSGGFVVPAVRTTGHGAATVASAALYPYEGRNVAGASGRVVALRLGRQFSRRRLISHHVTPAASHGILQRGLSHLPVLSATITGDTCISTTHYKHKTAKGVATCESGTMHMDYHRPAYWYQMLHELGGSWPGLAHAGAFSTVSFTGSMRCTSTAYLSR